MSEPRSFRPADFAALVLVFAVALGVRAWYLWACADGGRSVGPYEVQGGSKDENRDKLVANVRQGEFKGPAPLSAAEEVTAHVAPGYPWLLATAGRLPGDAGVFVRWGQAVLGSCAAGLGFLFAWRAFGSLRVAALAGLFCALHPYWIVNVAEVNDGVVASFLVMLTVYLGATCAHAGGAFGSLLYGLSLAGLGLVRAETLPFALAALAWFLWRCRPLPRGWLAALLAFLGFVNGLGPWVVRNFQKTGDVVPIVDSLYLHLWMGNNGAATGTAQDDDALLNALKGSRGKEVDDLRKALGEQEQRRRYAALADDVRREVVGHIGDTFRRRLVAAQCFALSGALVEDLDPWQTDTATRDQGPAWLKEAAPAAFYGSLLAMWGLALVGWRGTHGWRRRAMPSALAVVGLTLPYIVAHAETLHGPRLPLDGILLVYAAFALTGGRLWAGERPSV